MSSLAGPEEKPINRALPMADLSGVDAALPQGDEALREALKKVRAADVGRDLSRRSVEQSHRLVCATDERSAALMLRSAHPVVAAHVLSRCAPDHSVRVLEFLPINKQMAILNHFQPDARDKVHADLDASDRRNIQKLLGLSPSAVGRFATPKVWRAERTARVREALALLRSDDGAIEVAQNLYVTEKDKLVGVAPLRRVAISDPDATVESIMTDDVLSLAEETDVGDAAEIIRTHNFLSLPIVDKEGRLVGAVRVDDLLDAAMSQLGTGFLNCASAVSRGKRSRRKFPIFRRRCGAACAAAASPGWCCCSWPRPRPAPCCATSRTRCPRWWRCRSSSRCSLARAGTPARRRCRR